MSFSIKNRNKKNPIDVLLKSGKITIQPGAIDGPYPDSEMSASLKIKASRREIVIIQRKEIKPDKIDEDNEINDIKEMEEEDIDNG